MREKTELYGKNLKKGLLLLLLAMSLILCTGVVSASAAKRTGWYQTNGKTYYYNEQNKKVTGWNKIEGKRYYFDETGVMQTGFLKLQNKTYYLRKDGSMKTGWLKYGKKTFYFNKKGERLSGFQVIKDKTYYFSAKGVMRTGLVRLKGKTYYFTADGVMQKGWQTVNENVYYFNSKGEMHFGWLKKGSKKYYLQEDGVRKTGWLKLGKKKYYFNSKGVMQTGTVTIGDKVYFFDQDGVMDASKTTDRPMSELEKRCKSVVAAEVSAGDTRDTKIRKLFDYTVRTYSYYRTYDGPYPNGTEACANKMMTTGQGNCFSFAAVFGYLVKKATGLPVRLGYGDTPGSNTPLTPHGWCEVNINGTWYIFDPDLYKYGRDKWPFYYMRMDQVYWYYYNCKYHTVAF